MVATKKIASFEEFDDSGEEDVAGKDEDNDADEGDADEADTIAGKEAASHQSGHTLSISSPTTSASMDLESDHLSGPSGCKWTIDQLWSYLPSRGVDTEVLW